MPSGKGFSNRTAYVQKQKKDDPELSLSLSFSLNVFELISHGSRHSIEAWMI